MKWKWLVSLSALLLGFATLSPSLMAQSAPVPAATENPPADTGAYQPSENLPYPTPVVAYTPPTEQEKLQLFALQAFGPFAVLQATVAGGIQQATKSPPEWGSHWDGFGLRVASNFGVDFPATAATHYGLAEISHEELAYYTCQCKGLLPRLRHALVSTFTGRRRRRWSHGVFLRRASRTVRRHHDGARVVSAPLPRERRISDGQLQSRESSGRKSVARIYLRRNTQSARPPAPFQTPRRDCSGSLEAARVGEKWHYPPDHRAKVAGSTSPRATTVHSRTERRNFVAVQRAKMQQFAYSRRFLEYRRFPGCLSA